MPKYEYPGVYVTETSFTPASIPGVQTAVPAFIGYTEKAAIGDKPAVMTPVKIGSMRDYEEIFGGAFHSVFDIEPVAATKPPGPDAFDFFCQRQDPGPPPTWMTAHYRLKGGVAFNLYKALRLIYANGGGACYVVSAGPYSDGEAAVTFEQLNKGLDAIRDQSGPTMLVIPDAVLLPAANHDSGVPVSPDYAQLCKNMLSQCGDLTDRVAIFDIYGAGTLNQKAAGWENRMTALVDNFQTGVGDKSLSYGMAYFPFLETTVIEPREIDYTNVDIADPAQAALLQGILDDQAGLLFSGDQLATVKAYIAAIQTTDRGDEAAVAKLNQNLLHAIPLLQQIEAIIATKLSRMPPGAAMAGVYTLTDNERGVWHAPANTALSSVLTPHVLLNNDQQGELNVPLNGKSINVIRQFTGRGPVVWGARTLDGNSNDWRYIQVRRTLIYVEQSIKQALQPFVFAPNDGKTWVAVTTMVSGFLQDLWTQGGLMGAKADEAFTVFCGLGSTMTPLDIMNGYLVVQVTLQMIRPAEFIELTFRQKMEGAG